MDTDRPDRRHIGQIGSRIPGDVLDAMREEFDAGHRTRDELWAEVRNIRITVAGETRTVPEWVSRKTANRLVDKWNAAFESAPVSVAELAPTTARLLLDVLADVAVVTKGRVTTLTRAEAEWIGRVLIAAPSLMERPDQPVGPWEHDWRPYFDVARGLGWGVYVIAREYLLRTNDGRSTADLDLYLAFEPWRSPLHRQAYEAMAPAASQPFGFRRIGPKVTLTGDKDRDLAAMKQQRAEVERMLREEGSDANTQPGH